MQLDDHTCHCGKQLHYTSSELANAMAIVVAVRGRYVPVTTPDGTFLVCRHYIALHGIRGADLPSLGFVKEP